MHTSRCENAKHDKCDCSCRGKLHRTTRRQKERLKRQSISINNQLINAVQELEKHPEIEKIVITPPLESFEQ